MDTIQNSLSNDLGLDTETLSIRKNWSQKRPGPRLSLELDTDRLVLVEYTEALKNIYSLDFETEELTINGISQNDKMPHFLKKVESVREQLQSDDLELEFKHREIRHA